ncbi:phage tail protein I [Massilia atriviolacea]|uniref:Phage tail protein I n=1 Tax=Massilia atriviolacea TaxID=2495579 RepID=A0A430HF69_9BURK|nr:phage tail protein I [Massilia atriviolacea]RSZ56150.1 phage tail protein I [Massilia atriviolacea]
MPDHLLPSNASPAEQSMSLAIARVSDVPLAVRESWNPDTCPAHLLPWLAWQFSVDKWDTGWSAAQKRGAIKASIEVHRTKGTPYAVRTALEALGYPVVLTEWFKLVPLGDPYTFGVRLDASGAGVPGKAAYQTILDVIQSTKNVRSHLARLQVDGRVDGTIFAGGIPMCGELVKVAANEGELAGSDLIAEAIAHGFPDTEAAVDLLHSFIHTALPAANYW